MKKLSFFSIPRNKTRKETIEVIKNALIANGWKFVEKSEISLIDIFEYFFKFSLIRSNITTVSFIE